MSKTSKIILWCVLIVVLAMCIVLYIAAKRPAADTTYRDAGKTYAESLQPGDETPVITGGDFTITAHTFENMCTQNRACNYDDLSVSVFVNQHAAFMLDGAAGGAQPAYTVESGAIVRQLNIWMDHFRKLPAAQRLTGQDAIDYLTRCMRLL